MHTPLKIGYYRPLWEGFIHLYDYNAFFKMIWGPKHKFLHFSEWFEGKKHSQHQFFKKGQYSKNMQIYFKGFNKTSPQNEPLK
jgi:hypothetical protein